ncbi:helix-turn-helix transcriptional regulator, partial [Streptomyces sp. MMG1533]|uniref:helix-turn-helix transcriptional regulator n=1 Tax=Streptomyces sp. MMG1533 TaxID=1415546 RepID=UPI003B63A7CE
MQDNATEVTAAGIARLAGVGRAAVSNWRRRHADFPKPVGGTETSPSFALAEVEAWLRHQGKLAEVPLRERVWQQLAGHPEGPVTALTHAGCVLLLIHDRPTVWLEVSAGSDERLAAMLTGALEQVLVPRFGAPRGGRGGGRSVHRPPGVNSPQFVNTPGAVNTLDAVNSGGSENADEGGNTSGGRNTSGAVNTGGSVNTGG